MFNFFTQVWDAISGLISFVTDMVKDLIMLFGLVLQIPNIINGLQFLVPSFLLVFGIAFVAIYVINRISGGRN